MQSLLSDEMADQQIKSDVAGLKRAFADVSDDLETAKKKSHEVQVDFSTRIAKLEGHSTAFPWVAGIVLAAIAIIMAVVIAGGREVYLMNGRVAGIETTVTAIRLAQLSANPRDSQNTKEAIRVLSNAKVSKIKLPSEAIETTGNKFIDAARDNPDSWNAALAFVDYRSYLNGPNPPIEGFFPFGIEDVKGGEKTYYSWGSIVGKPLPQFTTSLRRVPIALSARSEPIGAPMKQVAHEGPESLLGVGGDLSLDGHYIRGMVLEGVTVHYDGGPVILENVTFIDCRFVIDNVESGRALSSQLLSSSRVTFRVPTA